MANRNPQFHLHSLGSSQDGHFIMHTCPWNSNELALFETGPCGDYSSLGHGRYSLFGSTSGTLAATDAAKRSLTIGTPSRSARVVLQLTRREACPRRQYALRGLVFWSFCMKLLMAYGWTASVLNLIWPSRCLHHVNTVQKRVKIDSLPGLCWSSSFVIHSYPFLAKITVKVDRNQARFQSILGSLS